MGCNVYDNTDYSMMQFVKIEQLFKETSGPENNSVIQ